MRSILLNILIFIISISSVLSQDTKEDSFRNKIKSYGELSYELIVAPGYGHIWDIKNKFGLGTAFHLGFGYDPLLGYHDFIMVRLFSRDLFRSNYLKKPEKYDLGIFSSVSWLNETIFYGITFCYYFNISNRFRLGIDSNFGRIETDDGVVWAPYLMAGIYFKLKRNQKNTAVNTR